MLDKKHCMDQLAHCPKDGAILLICAGEETSMAIQGDERKIAAALASLFERDPELLYTVLLIANARVMQAFAALARKARKDDKTDGEKNA